MIEHVFRRVKLCSQLDEVYVATCDEEIRNVAEGFGARVVMTSATHERATDRVAEAAEHLAAEIIIMVNGQVGKRYYEDSRILIRMNRQCWQRH